MKKISQKKIDLKDLTFCIPVRVESEYRRRNLCVLLEFLDKYLDTNYIILEADKCARFSPPGHIPDICYDFVEDDDFIFHRTKYINRMLDMATTPYAAVWDTDAIASVVQIVASCNLLRKNEYTLVYPYSGIFYELNEQLSEFFCQNPNIHILDNPLQVKFLLNGYYAVGGAYMVHIRKYKAVGGENQHFYGWGPEDMERLARLQILGEKTERIEGPLYHLFHTRSHNSNYASIETAINTKREFCKVCGMRAEELKEYIRSWDWLGRYEL